MKHTPYSRGLKSQHLFNVGKSFAEKSLRLGQSRVTAIHQNTRELPSLEGYKIPVQRTLESPPLALQTTILRYPALLCIATKSFCNTIINLSEWIDSRRKIGVWRSEHKEIDEKRKKMTVRKQKKKIIKETERSKEKQKEKKAEKNNIKENKYIMKKLHTTQITNCQFFPNTFPTIVCASTRHKPSFSIRPAAAAATVRNHHFHHRALVPHWVLDAELVQKCVCVCVCNN